ncbi:MAG: hypothetical protein ACREQE_11990, partial [Candidatus Binataceae bacterium]
MSTGASRAVELMRDRGTACFLRKPDARKPRDRLGGPEASGQQQTQEQELLDQAQATMQENLAYNDFLLQTAQETSGQWAANR